MRGVNASMKELEHKVTGEEYKEFLTRLAAESGIETPTEADLKRLDRNRSKKGSRSGRSTGRAVNYDAPAL